MKGFFRRVSIGWTRRRTRRRKFWSARGSVGLAHKTSVQGSEIVSEEKERAEEEKENQKNVEKERVLFNTI